MNATRMLASGSVMRLFTLVAGIAIGLYLVPYMLHALGDRSYGLWTVISVVVGYYGMLDFGLSQALGRYLAKAMAADDRPESDRLFNAGLAMYSLCGLGVMVVAVAVSAAASWIWSEPADAEIFAPLAVILGLNLAIGFPVRAFGGVLQAAMRFDLASRYRFLTLILQNAGIVLAIETGHGLVALGWVMLIGGLPEKVLTATSAMREMPWLRPSFSSARRDSVSTLTSFSFYLFLQRISQLMRFQSDSIVLTAFVGLAAVAHYRVAFSLIRYYRQLMQALFGVLLPAFSLQDGRGDKVGLERTFFISLRLSVGVSSFVGFALIAWGSPFIERWVGAAYLDAYPCLVALALGSLFGLWQSTLPTVLLSSGRERLVAALAVIEGIANVAVSVVLVQWYGMLGVALGTLIPSAVIRLLIQPVMGAQAMDMPVSRYLGELGKSVGASAIALAPGLFLTLRYATPDYLVLAALAAVTGLVYAPAFFWLGLRRADRRVVFSALRPEARKRARAAALENAAETGGEGHV